MNTIKNINFKAKLFLAGSISFIMFGLVYRDWISYQKKDNDFRKFMNDVKKLENESYMTREIASMIIESHD
jgi:predicted SprT family Zn-dependent metalloprotease